MFSGAPFVQNIGGAGLYMLFGGTVVLLAVILVVLLGGYYALGMRFDDVLGIASGATGNPAILAYANQMAPDRQARYRLRDDLSRSGNHFKNCHRAGDAGPVRSCRPYALTHPGQSGRRVLDTVEIAWIIGENAMAVRLYVLAIEVGICKVATVPGITDILGCRMELVSGRPAWR